MFGIELINIKISFRMATNEFKMLVAAVRRNEFLHKFQLGRVFSIVFVNVAWINISSNRIEKNTPPSDPRSKPLDFDRILFFGKVQNVHRLFNDFLPHVFKSLCNNEWCGASQEMIIHDFNVQHSSVEILFTETVGLLLVYYEFKLGSRKVPTNLQLDVFFIRR